jgi:alkanesulfonate monooxygenase SsuD/methylene tetrahydromethanopterin reductase-like flavin-dependent oxidoreductase (luciferase family)
MAASTNSVRFGINLTGPDRPYAELLATARVAEEAGFETLAFTDRPPENNFEGWTLASAIGVLTQRIRLTHNTLNVPFRNPALLAKMASSLDAICGGGRLILTLGAGAQAPHFETYGVPFGSPGERFADLKDAVEIIRGLWSQDGFTYAGRVFAVQDATVLPRPAPGGIPIYIGALGPRMMRYTGRVADGWLKNRGWPESLDELRGLVALLDEGANQAGRDPRTIRRVLNGAAAIGAGAAEAARERVARGGYAPAGSSDGLLGSVDEILNKVQQYRAAGADTFHLAFPPEDRHEQMRAFGREVIPRARDI